jgi:geranylgeranyl reductase family protein
MEKVDVLVVGAGPAGSSCAATIANADYSVVMLDKRASIGEPVQCAEYIPKLFLKDIDLEKTFITNEINSMITYVDFKEANESHTPGYLINRREFDRLLCLDAIRKGARLLLKAKAIHYEHGIVTAKTDVGFKSFSPQYIVGADGPLSTVGRWIGARNSSFVNAYQFELPKRGTLNATKVYFFKECPGGYGWVFPKENTFNVGVGVAIPFKKNPHEVLRFFLEKLNLKPSESIRTTKGLIPTNGILDSIVKGKIALVGDAAGLAHAITGAGIPQAVLSGVSAGKAIAKALEQDDFELLSEYDNTVIETWGSYVGVSQRKREYMERYWDHDDFQELIQKTWPAFREYYKEGKA